MHPINTARVIIGGLAAGLVINVSESVLNGMVLGADMQAAMTRMNLAPIAGPAIAGFVVMGFLLGIAMTWLYAAARPRFGPGPRTALIVGLAVWFFASVYGSVGMAIMGMFPIRLLTTGVIWGLVELLVAANVGAYLYKE